MDNIDSAEPKQSTGKARGQEAGAGGGEPTYTVEQVTDEFVTQTAFYH